MEPRQFLSSGVVVAAWPAKVAIRVTRGSRARRRLKPKHSNTPFRRALTSPEGGVFNAINIKKLIGEAR